MTCGFSPEHLYFTDEFERAFAIVAAINDVYLATHIFVDWIERSNRALTELESVSLGDMIAASILVTAWNDRPIQAGSVRTIHCVPDDRLVAAVYAFLNYRTDDHTEVILVAREHGATRFLAVGLRDTDEAETSQRAAA